MKLFLGILITLLVAAALTAAMQYDPGYILVAWGQTTVEMTVWVGLGVLLLVVGLLVVAFVLLRRGARLSDRLGSLRSDRRHRRDRDKTHRGLVAYIEGNWSQARRLLSDAARESERPLINYLLAARASHELGEIQARREYLGLAEKTGSGADIAVAVTQAELQLDSGQLEEALATLTRMRETRHPAVLKLLKQVYLGLGEWPALRELMPELRKHKVLDSAGLEQLEGRVYRGELQAVRNRGDGAALPQWWRTVPKARQSDRELLDEYLQALCQYGQTEEAFKLLRQTLKVRWEPALLKVYGQLQLEDSLKQLRVAEAWLPAHRDEPELLLTLGRLSLRNELWGKARDYFEDAHRRRPDAAVSLELARLYSGLGEADKARQFSDEAISQMGLPALPEPHRAG